MLTNDKAAEVVKHFRSRPRGGKTGLLERPRGLFLPVLRERGPHRPTPLPLALVTALRVEQTCCRRIGDRELSGLGVVFINLYSAALRAGRSFVSGRRLPGSGASAGSSFPAAAGPPRPARAAPAGPPARPAEGAEAPLCSSPSRRRSSRGHRRRQLPGRGCAAAAARRCAAERGCSARPPSAAAAARGVPRHFLTRSPAARARPTRSPPAPWRARSRGPARRRPRRGGGAGGGCGQG